MNNKAIIYRTRVSSNIKSLSILQKENINKFKEKVELKTYTMERLPCLCRSSDDILLSEVDRYGFELRTVLCKNCGLVRSDPYYSEKTLEDFYNEEYRPIYTGNKKCDFDFFQQQISIGRRIYTFIEEFVTSVKDDKTVFEIGCGAGGILKAFTDNGFKLCVGCDYGEDFLNYGIDKGLTLVKGSVDELRAYGKADLIIMNHVFEHLKDPLAYLEKIRELLKQQGLLYIAVPGIFSIGKTYNNDLLKFLQNAHAYHYTENTLRFVLSLAGFKCIKSNIDIQAIFQVSENNRSILMPNNNEYKNICKKLYYFEFSYRFHYIKNIFQYIKRKINCLKKIIYKAM